MSVRYYVLGSIALFCILYFSKELRDTQLADRITTTVPNVIESELVSSTRYLNHSSIDDVEETKYAIKEKSALEDWIQSRLTQKGLKEMTESGHWQAEQSDAL